MASPAFSRGHADLSGSSASGVMCSSRSSPWYAMTVKHNFERSVSSHLSSSGVETFVPMYKSKRTWSDRVKIIDLPLFSGYVFCSFDATSRPWIDGIPGVTGLVKFGRELACVDLVELDGIRAVMQSGLSVQPWPFLAAGRKVEINRGPLRGLTGIVDRARGAARLIVSVTMLNRSVAVEIDREWITPL